jgi:hypothetical protein
MAAFEILRATRVGPGESSRHHLIEMNSTVSQLGMLITENPSNDGVATRADRYGHPLPAQPQLSDTARKRPPSCAAITCQRFPAAKS